MLGFFFLLDTVSWKKSRVGNLGTCFLWLQSAEIVFPFLIGALLIKTNKTLLSFFFHGLLNWTLLLLLPLLIFFLSIYVFVFIFSAHNGLKQKNLKQKQLRIDCSIEPSFCCCPCFVFFLFGFLFCFVFVLANTFFSFNIPFMPLPTHQTDNNEN